MPRISVRLSDILRRDHFVATGDTLGPSIEVAVDPHDLTVTQRRGLWVLEHARIVLDNVPGLRFPASDTVVLVAPSSLRIVESGGASAAPAK